MGVLMGQWGYLSCSKSTALLEAVGEGGGCACEGRQGTGNLLTVPSIFAQKLLKKGL